MKKIYNLIEIVLIFLTEMLSNVSFNNNKIKAEKEISKVYKERKYVNKNMVSTIEKYDISVLIPLYNAENHIRRCIDSIIKQTTQYSYEIIIIDDGSVDNTNKILKQYEKQYENVKVFRQANKGISVARNIAMSKAQGKYISFVDSDDYLAEGFIETTLQKAYTEHLEYVKVKHSKVYNDQNQIIERDKQIKSIYDLDGYVWGAIIEKKILKDISFPEQYWFEDMITKLLIFPRINKWALIHGVYYHYVIHNDSATKTQGKIKNIKNLDQYFLAKNIIDIYKEIKIDINYKLYSVLLNEFGTVLMSRTRKLNFKTRKSIFILACKLIKELNVKEMDKEDRLLNKIFYSESFIAWNIFAIATKIKEKR